MSSTMEDLEKLATHVVPMIIDPGKVAFLMEPMASTVHFKASDKFNKPHLICDTAILSVFNRQSQPMLFFIKLQAVGARCGMPSGEEIALVAVNKTTVARTHQLFGSLCPALATEVRAAARFVGLRPTAGAIRRVYRWFHDAAAACKGLHTTCSGALV